jgi:hypothetical protein
MFIDPGSVKEAAVSMTHYREWAGEIANSYFNAGVAPTETLTKIAQIEELVPHQIEVLAAEANKEIHKHKYAAVQDKYFAADFPLADAKLVVKSLQADGGAEKLSAIMPEPTFKAKELDLFAAFGVSPETLDKTASVRHQLKVASVKGALLEQKIEDKLTMAKFAAEASERNFIKTARQYVLLKDDSAGRMRALGDLEHFVKSADMLEGRTPLAKLAYALGKEGLLTHDHLKKAFGYLSKEADVKAPEELISEWLPAQVVNGEHPLYITLKTFRDCKNALEDCYNDHKLIHDKFSVVKQKVRAL